MDVGPIAVAFTWVDEEHLAGPDLAGLRAVVEMESPACDDHRHWNCVAVLGHDLARLEAKPDDAHRTAVGDLLEAERAWTIACV